MQQVVFDVCVSVAAACYTGTAQPDAAFWAPDTAFRGFRYLEMSVTTSNIKGGITVLE